MENRYLKKYTEDQLRSCQLKQLEILKIFDSICKKHNLRYWIDGGTLLGAVRHGGFIPWDDDLDVAMPSEDYKKFNEIVQQELPEGLFWQTEKTDPSMLQDFGKIRDLNSFFVEFRDDFTLSYQKGIYIDVFEMVDYPSLPQPLVGFLLKRISKSRAVLRKKRYLGLHSLLETPYFLLIYMLFYPIWLVLKNFRGEKYISYQPVTNSGGWMYEKKDIFPLTRINFEGLDFSAPKNSHLILKSLYGDYMKLPSVDEREIHAIFIKTDLLR